MEVNPTYETFGRSVSLQGMAKVIDMPKLGILSRSHFFNPDKLNQELHNLLGYSEKNILVYFRNIARGIGGIDTNPRRKWWETIQTFKRYLGENFPAGLEMEYWYGPEGKEQSSPEFKKRPLPYQAFIKLFDNALQGFSCFVGEGKEGVSFSSDRTNYGTIKPGEALIHNHQTLWTGDRDVFLKSAERISQALHYMERYHNIGIGGLNCCSAEVRIISQSGKALIGGLMGDDSFTLHINQPSLEKIVREHNQEAKFLPE
ncbi:MAG: hypothetical protein AABX79_02745 [Nanoarchaeota archaeon]